jgi:hypothetical protein
MATDRPTHQALIRRYSRQFDRYDYVYPSVAFAISAIETGWWNPRARIVQNHNLFALKIRRHHPWLSLWIRHDEQGYAVYERDEDSMSDYKMYEGYVIRKYRLTNQQAYLDHICKRFCPANKRYRAHLLWAMNQYKPDFGV